VDRLGGLVDEETALQVFRDNAARLFRFAPEVLARPA
jgi:hypothetical protein